MKATLRHAVQTLLLVAAVALSLSAQAERNATRDSEIAVAEKITPTEADWLADRIGRDGELHASEKELVSYIRKCGADLPPKLKALVERAA